MDDKATRKRLLLKACDMISKCKPGVIALMEKYPAFLLRTIERNSKTIRDADPLSSAMAFASKKYTITVDASHPDLRYISKDNIMNENDTRMYGRIPAKRRAITDYQMGKVQPKEEDKATIDAIFDHSLRFWKKLGTVDWSKTGVEFGITQLERRVIITNPLEEPIAREFRRDAIISALGITSTLEYNTVPTYAVDIIRKILNQNQIGIRSLASLLHLINNMIDEQPRFLPTVPGFSAEYARVSHALVQPTFKFVGLAKLNETSKGRNMVVDEACQLLIHHFCKGYINTAENVVVAESITINGEKLTSVLVNAYETMHVKYAKAIIGREIQLDTIVHGVKFWVWQGNAKQEMHRNSGGHCIIIYRGTEFVNFKSESTSGSFSKNDSIMDLKINWTDWENMKRTLIAIRVYARVDIRSTKTRGSKAQLAELAKFAEQDYFRIIGANNERQFIKYIDKAREELNKPGVGRCLVGSVYFATDLSHKPPVPQRVEWSVQGRCFRDQFQREVLSAPRPSLAGLSYESIDCTIEGLFCMLAPKTRLIRAIKYNYRHIIEIINNIKKPIWAPICNITVHGRDRLNVNFSARKRILELLPMGARAFPHIAVLYLFTYETNELEKAISVSKFPYLNYGIIHLTFNQGIILVGLNGIEIFGKIIQNPFRINNNVPKGSFALNGIMLKEYRVDDIDKDAVLVPIQLLSEYFATKMEGEKALTNYQGTTFIAVKHSKMREEIFGTLGRFFDATKDPIYMNTMRQIEDARIAKRLLDDQEDLGPSEKRRFVEQSFLTLSSSGSSGNEPGPSGVKRVKKE